MPGNSNILITEILPNHWYHVARGLSQYVDQTERPHDIPLEDIPGESYIQGFQIIGLVALADLWRYVSEILVSQEDRRHAQESWFWTVERVAAVVKDLLQKNYLQNLPVYVWVC